MKSISPATDVRPFSPISTCAREASETRGAEALRTCTAFTVFVAAAIVLKAKREGKDDVRPELRSPPGLSTDEGLIKEGAGGVPR